MKVKSIALMSAAVVCAGAVERASACDCGPNQFLRHLGEIVITPASLTRDERFKTILKTDEAINESCSIPLPSGFFYGRQHTVSVSVNYTGSMQSSAGVEAGHLFGQVSAEVSAGFSAAQGLVQSDTIEIRCHSQPPVPPCTYVEWECFAYREAAEGSFSYATAVECRSPVTGQVFPHLCGPTTWTYGTGAGYDRNTGQRLFNERDLGDCCDESGGGGREGLPCGCCGEGVATPVLLDENGRARTWWSPREVACVPWRRLRHETELSGGPCCGN